MPVRLTTALSARKFALRLLAVFVLPVFLFAQDPAPPAAQPDQAAQPDKVAPPTESKRLLFIVPNYRTAPTLKEFSPLTPKDKFKIASQDAFDRGTIVLAALFAGESQLTNDNPSYGQGGAGYGKYFAASYGGFVIGDFMTEGIFPSLLHQDPRYFRKGAGSGAKKRLGYSMAQIFVTHNDSGHAAVNWSELLGNSTAVAISTSYYASNRSASASISSLGTQLGVDMASNVLKEFWPEIGRMFSHKKDTAKQ
jgi:hypothetical protein